VKHCLIAIPSFAEEYSREKPGMKQNFASTFCGARAQAGEAIPVLRVEAMSMPFVSFLQKNRTLHRSLQ